MLENIKERIANAGKWLAVFGVWWDLNVSDRDSFIADETYEDWLDRQY